MGLTWKTFLLIDSESSGGIFNNKKCLPGICKVDKQLKLHYNAGCTLINQKGWFGDIDVWYNPKGIATILSLKTLKQSHHITYDSKDRDGDFKIYPKMGVVEF